MFGFHCFFFVLQVLFPVSLSKAFGFRLGAGDLVVRKQCSLKPNIRTGAGDFLVVCTFFHRNPRTGTPTRNMFLTKVPKTPQFVSWSLVQIQK